MGKRIEDLPLDDTPIAADPPQPSDARDAAWYRFSVDIEDMLATGQYRFAQDTLEGIQETVERTQRVTEGQRRAVANIEASREKHKHGRRYEGFY